MHKIFALCNLFYAFNVKKTKTMYILILNVVYLQLVRQKNHRLCWFVC